ncbi:MAG: hypothetical protein RLZZ59_724 [Pseudomonadota bacterium]|jgi:tRNA threonylcarbamoyl adenosine modification protein YeaZ
MKILAFETASGRCSVSISDKDQILAAELISTTSMQAERLISTIQNILEKTSLNLNDIDYIATTNGPGSFTGIRIGLATILGLSMAKKKTPVIVSNFDIINFRIREQSRNFDYVATIIDAYRDEYYFQIFDKSNEIILPGSLVKIDFIENQIKKINGQIVSGGSGLVKLCNSLDIITKIHPRFPNPDARTICRLAYSQILKGNFSSNIEPLYIRPPDAKLPNTC